MVADRDRRFPGAGAFYGMTKGRRGLDDRAGFAIDLAPRGITVKKPNIQPGDRPGRT